MYFVRRIDDPSGVAQGAFRRFGLIHGHSGVIPLHVYPVVDVEPGSYEPSDHERSADPLP